MSISPRVDGIGGQMRARPVVGCVVPAWAVPAPRLHIEPSLPTVHALGRRRALPRSSGALSPLATDVTGQCDCIVGGNQSHRKYTSLRSGVQIEEEERCDEASPRKHDEDTADAYATTIHAQGRNAAAEDEADCRGERVEKKGRVRHRLSPMQVQQQALIGRIRTLETRRDWRGVLAAMVRTWAFGRSHGSYRTHRRETEEKAHQSAVVELRDTVWLPLALVRKNRVSRKARATAVPLWV